MDSGLAGKFGDDNNAECEGQHARAGSRHDELSGIWLERLSCRKIIPTNKAHAGGVLSVQDRHGKGGIQTRPAQLLMAYGVTSSTASDMCTSPVGMLQMRPKVPFCQPTLLTCVLRD